MLHLASAVIDGFVVQSSIYMCLSFTFFNINVC